jgi:hypothetical protein
MSRTITTEQGYVYRYAPRQPNNLVWLARKANVGYGFFYLHLAVAYEDAEDEITDFSVFEERHGVKLPSDEVQIGREVPTKMFKRLVLTRSEYTRSIENMIRTSKSEGPTIAGVGLHGFGGWTFSAEEFSAILAFVNKGLPKKLKLDFACFERGTPADDQRPFYAPHEPRSPAVLQAFQHLCTHPEKALESYEHRALALELLHDAVFWEDTEVRAIDGDVGFAQPIGAPDRVPYPRFAHNGFYLTSNGYSL